METKLLFKKVEKIIAEIHQQVVVLENAAAETIATAESALLIIDMYITQVKEMITAHNFQCMAEEIYFFKNLKPQLISPFIYYSKILSIETYKPNGSLKTQKKYYEQEQVKLKYFYDENKEFYNYYRRQATYLDHKYFLRNAYDLKMKLGHNYYNFDHNFSTPCDDLVSLILANDKVENYLLNSLTILLNPQTSTKQQSHQISWSSSKVALVELIYALYHTKCFNGGNVDLSEIIRLSEKLLEVDLSNFHKVLGEIKSRKTGRTKFLQLLNDSLEQHFNDLDA